MGSGIGSGAVSAILIAGTDVYVGGSFTDAGGVGAADRIGRWSTSGAQWFGIDTGIANGTVRTIAISGNNLYLGGTFTNADGIADVMKWILSRDLPFSLNFYRQNLQSQSKEDLRLEEPLHLLVLQR